MSRFIPVREINVTNVFPTEPAPKGLNYYVSIDELPYYSWCVHDWNVFLRDVHQMTEGSMGGLRSALAFGPEWAKLKYLSAMECDVLVDFGYNPIFSSPGRGPVVWGHKVQGTQWTLPQLSTAVEVIVGLKTALDDLIASEQMHLFFEDSAEVHRARAVIHAGLNYHRASRDLYCQRLNDPTSWMRTVGNDVILSVPIQPLMIMKPLLFNIKLTNAKIGAHYEVSKEFSAEHQMMQQLFGISDFDIGLETPCKS